MLFLKLFNEGNLPKMIELIDADITTVLGPGRGTVTGKTAWAREIQGFLDLKLPLNLRIRSIQQSGNIAQVVSDWTIEGNTAAGKPIREQGTGIDVLRRDSLGNWRYIIDNPFGVKFHK
ncbi:nuclear transport factor 2 family protein [Streptomyces sp. TX20-6-3]|uniref:YybH family protein n=1 Tax=Streptomyces sp. TX20-6-3 TaxID=3028705 RepID=UPI0029AFB652|nr:nuclear transport factor 2 family protein [Streptomyces sp. TX20-6-3]MDX2565361.1 nuclear transport factor 2 family protein [Streptomyces sp. TX20-6-3]